MTDVYSKEKRSWLMGRVRAAGNRSTEGKLIAILKQHRLTGWRRKYPIFGKPDIVFPRNKVAVFADGCFWHACPKHAQIPASNRKFWRKKLEANKNRDKLVNRTIKNKGWKVLRFWECELKDERRLRRKLNRLGELLQDTRP
ncbi:MAG: Very-short-patch mismatch repair endonuclease (G-T specific) [Arenicellales bacterium IbO2]|nr:very short patch repair endonuclease [Alphaproteobacteria bacterium]CAJ2377684.1 MAG: Very-short-patch mismatch repair endonuclease (G-T specific) [Arenicellales bacterium IbO2]